MRTDNDACKHDVPCPNLLLLLLLLLKNKSSHSTPMQAFLREFNGQGAVPRGRQKYHPLELDCTAQLLEKRGAVQLLHFAVVL